MTREDRRRGPAAALLRVGQTFFDVLNEEYLDIVQTTKNYITVDVYKTGNPLRSYQRYHVDEFLVWVYDEAIVTCEGEFL